MRKLGSLGKVRCFSDRGQCVVKAIPTPRTQTPHSCAAGRSLRFGVGRWARRTGFRHATAQHPWVPDLRPCHPPRTDHAATPAQLCPSPPLHLPLHPSHSHSQLLPVPCSSFPQAPSCPCPGRLPCFTLASPRCGFFPTSTSPSSPSSGVPPSMLFWSSTD